MNRNFTPMTLNCPMCKKALEPAISPCPRCRTDLRLLVDYMSNLEEHLSKADAAMSMIIFLVILENLTLIPPQAVESL